MTCWLSGERSLPFGLLVDWIFFILAGNEDNYKSLDELNFGRILPLTSELAALERLKKRHIILLHSSAFIFDRIFFILAGIEDNLNISDKFKILHNLSTYCGVSCP